MNRTHNGEIAVLNCGSQYAHLIANQLKLRVGRRAKVYPHNTPSRALRSAAGVIISGSPASVYESKGPRLDSNVIYDLQCPILGICYGMHCIVKAFNGKVNRGKGGEFGPAKITVVNGTAGLLRSADSKSTVWMSHGDHVISIPEASFKLTATSESCQFAAVAHKLKPIYGWQFHPEVKHTEQGLELLERFADQCDAAPYSLDNYIDHLLQRLRDEVGDRKVLMLLSGGVDSSVSFQLLVRALGQDRVHGLLIDNGLMRQGEIAHIERSFAELGLTNVETYDASEQFLAAIAGLHDPQAKREAIGRIFVKVFLEVAAKSGRTFKNGWMLGQGTLYPDWIESGSEHAADQIKLHHNLHQLVADLRTRGLVVEPLRDLYKDEVRRIGHLLNMPHKVLWRRPFPGPGLAVRILCAKRKPTLPAVQKLWRRCTWPRIDHPHTILPIKSVGVQGDQRSYTNAAVLFLGIESGLTLDHLDQRKQVATHIANTVRQVNRVAVCLSHAKPFDFCVTPQSVTKERIKLLQEADAIVSEELAKAPQETQDAIWQFPVILLPCGPRPNSQSVVLRPIESTNAMTAQPHLLPASILSAMRSRLLLLAEIGAVLYDITTKPPGTIEWE